MLRPPRQLESPIPANLLTQVEASEAIGAKLGPGELKRMGIITRCTYYNRATDQMLWLDVHNETAPEPDAVLFDSYTHMPNVKPVSGIGDQALWSHSDFGSDLDILKGGRLVLMGLPRTMTNAYSGGGKGGNADCREDVGNPQSYVFAQGPCLKQRYPTDMSACLDGHMKPHPPFSPTT